MSKKGKKRRKGIVCNYCKRPLTKPSVPMRSLSATKDHVKPKSEGGRKTVPCCFACNNMKGNMSISEWINFMSINPKWWLNWRGHPKNKP